jgi:hypothetical protein
MFCKPIVVPSIWDRHRNHRIKRSIAMIREPVRYRPGTCEHFRGAGPIDHQMM